MKGLIRLFLFLYLIDDLLFLSVDTFEASSEYSLFSWRFEESIPNFYSLKSWSLDIIPAWSFDIKCFEACFPSKIYRSFPFWLNILLSFNLSAKFPAPCADFPVWLKLFLSVTFLLKDSLDYDSWWSPIIYAPVLDNLLSFTLIN